MRHTPNIGVAVDLDRIRGRKNMKGMLLGHHKCGTLWTDLVLKNVLGSRFKSGNDHAYTGSEDLYFHGNGDPVRTKIPSGVKAISIIRDPRDIAVSAYFSHRYVHGLWDDLKVHREHLNRLNTEDGMCLDIEWSNAMPGIDGHPIRIFSGLEFKPPVVNVRFENLIINPVEVFSGILRDMEINFDSKLLVEVLDKYSFSNMADGRKHGDRNINSHYRSGKPGEWHEWFTAKVKKCFKRLHEKLPVRLGYEEGEW